MAFFTFSLRSPPPPSFQLAFNLATLSPRRAAAVPKYGRHLPFGTTRRNNLRLATLSPPLFAPPHWGKKKKRKRGGRVVFSSSYYRTLLAGTPRLQETVFSALSITIAGARCSLPLWEI